MRKFHKLINWLLVVVIILIIGDGVFFIRHNLLSQPAIKKKVQYNVPEINQMSAPVLYNGCEVTSMAMLLQYYGSNVTKNELAHHIKKVPLKYESGKHGNPNKGFVGSVSGATQGLGVFHGPVKQVAQKYNSHVKDISGSDFNKVIRLVSSGHPVWIITTANFTKVSDMQKWKTPQGNMKVTFSQHSVVITGYNKAKKVIYINNPYGQKNQAVPWDDFVAAYNQMGKQAIYVDENHK